MRIARWAVTAATALSLLGVPTAAVSRAADVCHDRTQPAYSEHDCKVARLRERSFVVVALLDTGITPYHHDFRLAADDDRNGVHPSEYIEGFPAPDDAPALRLALEEASYESAVSVDEFLWQSVEQDRLYTFPGTKIIGGYSVSADRRWGDHILDTVNSHGTATASVLAGATHGLAKDPDVVVVAVQGLGPEAVQWATSQPWIDVISNSWGYGLTGHSDTPEHRYSKAFTESGGMFVTAAGNGLTGSMTACDRSITPLSPMAGPPWNLVVGAVSPKNGQPHCWHSIPPDVSSYGSTWPAAAGKTLEGEVQFGGTSNATPMVAGAAATVLLTARGAVGDTAEGRHDGALAHGAPGAGALADGTVTNDEIEQALLKTASVKPFSPTDLVTDPATTPNTPAYPVYAGYGLVNAATTQQAESVLLGQSPMPDRSDVDAWMAVRDSATGAYWRNKP